MARKPPPEHSRFKPGQSGNPKGRSPDILSPDKVRTVLGKFADMSRAELQAVVQNDKSTMLEIMIASVMAKAAKDGDYARLSFIMDRSIGRVKDITEVHQHNYDQELDKEPKENVLKILRELRGPKLEA